MIIQTERGLKRAVFSLDTEGSPVHEGRMRGGGREGERVKNLMAE